MASAYRCDSCNDYFEGQPGKYLDLHVGDFILGVLFGRELEPPATPDSTDKFVAALEEDESTLGRLIHAEMEKMSVRPKTVAAELCEQCQEDLAIAALSGIRDGSMVFSQQGDDDDPIRVAALSPDDLDKLGGKAKRIGGFALGPFRVSGDK